MSRERKEKESIARKGAYRAERGARVLQTSSSSDDTDAYVRRLLGQLNAMPGKPEERYVVLLRCSGNDFYSYPLYGCAEGFTAALKDAIEKHQSLTSAAIEGGMVQGVGDASYNPPGDLVRMMALGAKVVVTNRMQNRVTKKSDLRGSVGQGGGKN